MRRRVLTLAVGALIVIVLMAYLFSFQVRETQVAVVLTFGKPSTPITEPGIYFQWPWPVQSVRKFDRRVNVFETKLEETLTADRQNITVSLAVGWRVDPVDPAGPRKFLERTATTQQAQRFVTGLVEHQSSIIGRYNLDNLVSTKPEDIKFDEIEKQLAAAVSSEARKEYGIDVPLVRIRRLELPDGPTTAVYERMKAEREKEVKKFRSEGIGRADEIRGRADSEREQILARARADAERIRGEGDAEAAKYYETFDKHKELAIFLRETKALRKILAERSTVILDPRSTPFGLLFASPNVSGAPASGSAAGSAQPAEAAQQEGRASAPASGGKEGDKK